jgi:hypothetical protein
LGILKQRFNAEIIQIKYRKVELSVRIGSFTIQAPQQSRSKALKDPRPVKMYAVYVQESAKSITNNEPLVEWMLLTSLVTNDLETALTRIQWDKYRWRIEIYQSYYLRKSQMKINEPSLLENDKSIAWVDPLKIAA